MVNPENARWRASFAKDSLMSKIKVGVVHTFLYSVEDIKEQFRRQLPEVEMINIIDDSLLQEALANKGLTRLFRK